MIHTAGKYVIRLTFDHDHVDVYGTDCGLRQSLSLLQQVRDVTCSHTLIGALAKGEQLPNGYPWVKQCVTLLPPLLNKLDLQQISCSYFLIHSILVISQHKNAFTDLLTHSISCKFLIYPDFLVQNILIDIAHSTISYQNSRHHFYG